MNESCLTVWNVYVKTWYEEQILKWPLSGVYSRPNDNGIEGSKFVNKPVNMDFWWTEFEKPHVRSIMTSKNVRMELDSNSIENMIIQSCELS